VLYIITDYKKNSKGGPLFQHKFAVNAKDNMDRGAYGGRDSVWRPVDHHVVDPFTKQVVSGPRESEIVKAFNAGKSIPPPSQKAGKK
jgi:hypothetical protein